MNRNLIQQTQKFAQALERFAFEHRDNPEVLPFCQFAATWIAWHPCGIWASPMMERVIRNYCKEATPTDQANSATHQKILLVLTHAFQTGGHTRIAEAFLRERPKASTDIFIDSPNFPIPDSLSNLGLLSHSKITQSKTNSLQQTAIALQDLGKDYRCIVLLTHPEDPIPILSFGHENWNIPILLYNHADHQFWFGVSVADLTLNLSTKASSFSQQWRGTIHNAILPTPLQVEKPRTNSRSKLREALGISDHTYLLFSAGSSHKYNPIGSRNFVTTILKVLKNCPRDVLCIVAGPSPDTPFWKQAYRESNGRIRAIGKVNHDCFLNWLSAADLYVDSIPTSGWTTLLEATALGVPIAFENNGEFFPDCLNALSSPIGSLPQQIMQRMEAKDQELNTDFSDHVTPKWGENLEALIKQTCIHKVHSNFIVPDSTEDDPLTPVLMDTLQPSHHRHGRNYLLLLSFPFRLSVAGFMLRQRQWKIAFLVLLFNHRRYVLLKNVIASIMRIFR